MSYPILFKGPMVRAILDGSKTETRRIVKGEALEWLSAHGFTPEYTADPGNGFSRYGYKDDELWVKETWAAHKTYDKTRPRDLRQGVTIECRVEPTNGRPHIHRQLGIGAQGRWRPSIFMRHWMSRIALVNTSVHIERLQAITSEGAINEGIERHTIVSSGHTEPIGWRDYSLKVRDPFESYTSPINSYKSLWESINGAGSWELNPWVWVIKFKRRA